MVATIKRQYPIFESEKMRITVVDYGSVSEHCQYCNHPVRFHFVIDDKETGQTAKIKVGSECVKLFMRQAGVSDVLIERADSVIQKQVRAFTYVTKFENLDVDEFVMVLKTVVKGKSIRRKVERMVNDHMKKIPYEYGVEGYRRRAEERARFAREDAAVCEVGKFVNSEMYALAMRRWDKKYKGYRGAQNLEYKFCRSDNDANFDPWAVAEVWQKQMVAFYLKPVESPYYFGGKFN